METEVQAAAREAFDDLVRDVRTDLHRYCSRMVGSSIEGEDVVQDVLAKAFYQLSELAGVANSAAAFMAAIIFSGGLL